MRTSLSFRNLVQHDLKFHTAHSRLTSVMQATIILWQCYHIGSCFLVILTHSSGHSEVTVYACARAVFCRDCLGEVTLPGSAVAGEEFSNCFPLKIRCLMFIMKEVGFICCAVRACSCISASLLAPQSCLPLSCFTFSSFSIALTAASPALLPGESEIKTGWETELCLTSVGSRTEHQYSGHQTPFLIVTAAKSMSNSLKQF